MPDNNLPKGGRMSGDTISIVAAMAADRVIGRGDELPWQRIPWDFRNFKALTEGHSVIMGSRTFTSIVKALGKPLPNRYTIVVSQMRDLIRTSEYAVARTIENALEIAHARENGNGEIFVAGGGEIYRQTLPFVDRLYLTFIKTEVPGDVFFPPLNPRDWRLVSAEEIAKGDSSPYALKYKIFDRNPH